VGDLMLGRGVARALGGEWGTAFASVAPVLRDAGLTIGNLESPLTEAVVRAPARWDLRASPDAAAALEEAGFDVVSLANNHALDAGQAGLTETERALRARDIEGLRAGAMSCHSGVCILALDDSTVPLSEGEAAAQVAAAGKEAALVIVSVHWGGEYQAQPSPRQVALARALAAAGADLIVGHGPHVLQSVAWVDRALVAYSMGNFLFDQPYPADCRQGAVLWVTACGGQVCGLGAVPTAVSRGRVLPAGRDERSAILERLGLQMVDHPADFEPHQTQDQE
jgi:poly-gamma-glutamate synthesis protein (capsule biosynthesis protein)